jgi:drug/metabolite transporter (DMT)-like permease
MQTKSKQVYLGCLYMFLGIFMFGLGNVLIKKINLEVPVIQTLFVRAFLSGVGLAAYFYFFGKKELFKTHNRPLQIIRGVIGFFSLYTLYLSFDLLPLTDATAISFATPLFITALSFLVLKEKVTAPLWIAVCVGFIGVSIMAEPTGHVTLLGAGVAIFSAFFESLVMLFSRLLSRKDAPLTSVFYHATVIAIIAGCLTPFFWVPVSFSTMLLLILFSLISCLGQIFVVYAYTTAPAVALAPIIYTLMIWGALFGWFVWGESLSHNLLIGMPIVILTGLYIVRKESQKTL